MMNTKIKQTELGRLIYQQGRPTAWVAEQMGISISTLWRYCTGERHMPTSRVAQIAELLGVPENEIVTNSGDGNA